MTFSSRVAEAMERNEETRASAVSDASPEGSKTMDEVKPLTNEEAALLVAEVARDRRALTLAESERVLETASALSMAETSLALHAVTSQGATPHDYKRETLAQTGYALARTLNELKANPSPTSLEVAATLMHELKLVSLDLAELRRISQASRGAR